MTPAEALDSLPGPHRIYVLAIKNAEMEYRQAMHAARRKRETAIQEALEACEAALRLGANDDPPEYDPDDGEAQRIADVFAPARAEQDRGL